MERRGEAKWLLCILIALIAPERAQTQSAVVVEGRVVESGTASVIQNAVVELVGHGSTLTAANGGFRYPSRQELRIPAWLAESPPAHPGQRSRGVGKSSPDGLLLGR
jgi:hypothetical protein